MASRIGKYKVSKREAALSAVDGATISGNLTGISNLATTGTVTFANFSDQAGAATTSNKVFITSSAGVTGSGTSYKVLCIG